MGAKTNSLNCLTKFIFLNLQSMLIVYGQPWRIVLLSIVGLCDRLKQMILNASSNWDLLWSSPQNYGFPQSRIGSLQLFLIIIIINIIASILQPSIIILQTILHLASYILVWMLKKINTILFPCILNH